MLNGISNLPHEEQLRKLGMFSLSYCRLHGDTIKIKFMHGQSTSYLSGMLEFNDKARGRGHQFRLVVKQNRTRLRQSF